MILMHEEDVAESISLKVQMVLAKMNSYINLPVYLLICM